MSNHQKMPKCTDHHIFIFFSSRAIFYKNRTKMKISAEIKSSLLTQKRFVSWKLLRIGWKLCHLMPKSLKVCWIKSWFWTSFSKSNRSDNFQSVQIVRPRVSERMSCQQSAIFPPDIAYIPRIRQNHVIFLLTYLD